MRCGSISAKPLAARTGAAHQGARSMAAICPEQDARLAAPAIVGVLERTGGPLAPSHGRSRPRAPPCRRRRLLALRALGVIDARARGLVAQCEIPLSFAPLRGNR